MRSLQEIFVIIYFFWLLSVPFSWFFLCGVSKEILEVVWIGLAGVLRVVGVDRVDERKKTSQKEENTTTISSRGWNWTHARTDSVLCSPRFVFGSDIFLWNTKPEKHLTTWTCMEREKDEGTHKANSKQICQSQSTFFHMRSRSTHATRQRCINNNKSLELITFISRSDCQHFLRTKANAIEGEKSLQILFWSVNFISNLFGSVKKRSHYCVKSWEQNAPIACESVERSI